MLLPQPNKPLEAPAVGPAEVTSSFPPPTSPDLDNPLFETNLVPNASVAFFPDRRTPDARDLYCLIISASCSTTTLDKAIPQTPHPGR